MSRPSRAADAAYRQRLLGAAVAVLGVCLALVHGWPRDDTTPSDLPFRDVGQDVIEIEEIVPTSQSRQKNPPPPAPLPPVVVPNDRIIEFEADLGTSALDVETPGDDAELQEGTSDPATASRTPDTGARLLRAVQPDYPTGAQDDDVQARLVVEIQVSAAGRVTDAFIKQRWMLVDGRAIPVESLGYGLDAAALTAARRSLFRPARASGEPVPTRTTLTFTFGQ